MEKTFSLINPTRVSDTGVMRGRRNKPDRADARLIAAGTYGEASPAWVAPWRFRKYRP